MRMEAHFNRARHFPRVLGCCVIAWASQVVAKAPDAVPLGTFEAWALDGQARDLLDVKGDVKVRVELLEYRGPKRMPALGPTADLRNQMFVDIASQLAQAAFQQAAMGNHLASAEALGYLSGALYEATKKPLAFARVLPRAKEPKAVGKRLLVTLPARATSVRFAFVRSPVNKAPITW